MSDTVLAEGAGVSEGASERPASRREMRAFERAVLGAPAVPPGRLAQAMSAIRGRVLGAHRAAAPPPLVVLEALFGRFDGHVLAAMVALGLPDRLDRPITAAELAEVVGADPDRLERLLRYAAARGFVRLDRAGRVRANAVTRALRTDAAAPWRGWVEFATSDWFGAAWGALPASLADGSPPPFEAAHGHDFFTHTRLHPEAGAAFDRAMEAGAALQAIGLARGLDWDDVGSVCDVGGGTGAALAVLQRYAPHLDVTLLDLPEVVARAGFDEDAPHRRIVGGSFFDAVPEGRDRYLLLAIVHDWDDERARAILANVRRAMPAHGRVIVVETVATERPRDDVATATDLLMLVLASGRERTVEQYDDLFGAAGLDVAATHLLPSGSTAFELAGR